VLNTSANFVELSPQIINNLDPAPFLSYECHTVDLDLIKESMDILTPIPIMVLALDGSRLDPGIALLCWHLHSTDTRPLARHCRFVEAIGLKEDFRIDPAAAGARG
jgi:hypothetical protein